MSYILLIVVSALLGGSVPTLAKFALDVFPTFILLFLRFAVASLTLLPLIIKSRYLNPKAFKAFAVVGIMGAINPIILYNALKYTQASVSPLIYAASPLLTALIVSKQNAEKISRNMIKGIIVGLLGVMMIILLPLISNHASQQLSLKGNLMIFLAMIAFTSYGILSKQKQKEISATPAALAFYFSLFSVIITFPFALNEFNSGLMVWSNVTSVHWMSVIATGVLGTTLFYLAYQNAILKGGPTAASLFTYLQPIVGIALPVLLLGETISLPFIIGAVLALLGVQIASRKKLSLQGRIL
ncbi:MAG: DMT family transporter [Patescibacteria group bacterium]|nr:DMT family transporter [Patescibacteria group bacterium]